MKNLLSIVALLCCFSLCSLAQITITRADIANVGDTIIVAEDNSPSPGPGSAGPNQSWDLSGLSSGNIDTIFLLDPATTPYAAVFAGSDMAGSTTDGNDSILFYMETSSASIKYDGYWLENLGLIDLNPSETWLNFPLAYQDVLYDTSSYLIPSVFVDSIISTIPFVVKVDSVKVTNYTYKHDTVDGWGQVTTPLQTINALRTFDTKITIDTIWIILNINGIPGGWSVGDVQKDTSWTYYWYANGVGQNLVEMEVNGNGVSIKAEYISYQTITGLEDNNAYRDISFYPNPARDKVRIVSKVELGQLLVYDLEGRKVIQEKVQGEFTNLDVSGLKSGMYLVRILDHKNRIVGEEKLRVQ